MFAKFLKLSIFALAVFGFAAILNPGSASAVSDVCPNDSGWVKVDGLSGLTYTYSVPAGYEVTENCMKVGSHTPVYGVGNTVTNTTLFNSPGNLPAGQVCTAPGVPVNGCSLQSISHAAFKLVQKAPEDPTILVSTAPCLIGSGSTDAINVNVTNPNDNEVEYTVTVGTTSQTVTVAGNSNEDVEFSGLAADTYAITVSGDDGTSATSTVEVSDCPVFDPCLDNPNLPGCPDFDICTIIPTFPGCPGFDQCDFEVPFFLADCTDVVTVVSPCEGTDDLTHRQITFEITNNTSASVEYRVFVDNDYQDVVVGADSTGTVTFTVVAGTHEVAVGAYESVFYSDEIVTTDCEGGRGGVDPEDPIEPETPVEETPENLPTVLPETGIGALSYLPAMLGSLFTYAFVYGGRKLASRRK